MDSYLNYNIRQDLQDRQDYLFLFSVSGLQPVGPKPRREETGNIKSPSAKKTYLFIGQASKI